MRLQLLALKHADWLHIGSSRAHCRRQTRCAGPVESALLIQRPQNIVLAKQRCARAEKVAHARTGAGMVQRAGSGVPKPAPARAALED